MLRHVTLAGALLSAAHGCDRSSTTSSTPPSDDTASAARDRDGSSSADAPPLDPGAAWTYTVTLERPTTQFLELRIDVPAGPDRPRRFAMPAWTPGSYLIRDFAKHVYAVEAIDDGGDPLSVRKLDKQTWEVSGHDGQAFALRYRVYAAELSVRTSFVDDRFGLLNGTSVFMYEPGAVARPLSVRFELPPGWSTVGALPPAADPDRTFAASSYDALVDAPFVIGAHQLVSFEVANARFDYLLTATAPHQADIDRLAADAKKVVEAFHAVLGDFPFERYLFITVIDAGGGGGLEHADACAMILRPSLFDRPNAYRRASDLLAHEFFHLWNVKRIRDRVLGPFDYARENYTGLLWFHEGFTETMERRALRRAGIIGPEEFLAELEHGWNAYTRRPGRNYAPIAQISRDAWIKGYQPSPAHWNTSVSYYQKGNIIGVALDAELHARAAAHDRQGSLEGLFQSLWEGRDAKQLRRITLDDLVAVATKLAGEDMTWFFDAYVDGTEEVDLPGALRSLGVVVRATPAGGAWSGLSGRGREITRIDADGPAAAAGFMVGDRITTVDGKRLDDIDALDTLAGPGNTLSVVVMRRDRRVELQLTLAESPHQDWTFTLPKDPAPPLKRFLQLP